MSTEAIINSTTRLARALRLEDLLINASAVPLPIDLMPSMMSQPTPDDDAQQDNTDAASVVDHNVLAQISEAPHAITSTNPAPGEAMQDSVLTALQATRDAIGMSLRHDVSVSPTEAIQSAAVPTADVPVQNDDAHNDHAHNENVPAPKGEHVQNIVADGLQNISLPSADSSGGTHSFDATGDMTALGPLPLTAANPLSLASEIVSGISPLASALVDTNLLETADIVVAPATVVLQAAIPGALAIVTETAATAGGVTALLGGAAELADEITAAAHAPLASIATLASTVGALTPVLAGTGTSSSAPLSAVADILENVTVSSLKGTGFDALVGLLPPSSTAPEAAHVLANPVHASVEELSIGVPIGTEDVTHSELAPTHAVHSLLSHVGSGLI